jgi:hypothetical protein
MNLFENGCEDGGSRYSYGLDGQGSIPDKGKKFVFIPQSPDRLWGPPSLLSNRYRGILPRGCRGVKLSTHLHPEPRSRIVELYLHSPICLRGTVFNYLSTGKPLPFSPL